MAPASPKQRPPSSERFLRFAGTATQMAVTIGLGVWGGIQLDRKFPNDYHAWTLILSLLSVGLSIYMVIRDFLRNP